MNRVLIIQARMGSTRLPGKVLFSLGGTPMLFRQIERLKRCTRVDRIVVATTTSDRDDILAEHLKKQNIDSFRGSESDVLDRYYQAAKKYEADIVVRVTADCPLIDPVETDRVIEVLEKDPSVDYASNIVERTYPRGLDTEAFSFHTLERLNERATSKPSREHVTWHLLRERPEDFAIRSVTHKDNNSHLRWTVDTLEDFELIKQIFEGMRSSILNSSYDEVLAFVLSQPNLTEINQHIEQKLV